MDVETLDADHEMNAALLRGEVDREGRLTDCAESRSMINVGSPDGKGATEPNRFTQP
jgi:hypothetical protein